MDYGTRVSCPVHDDFASCCVGASYAHQTVKTPHECTVPSGAFYVEPASRPPNQGTPYRPYAGPRLVAQGDKVRAKARGGGPHTTLARQIAKIMPNHAQSCPVVPNHAKSCRTLTWGLRPHTPVAHALRACSRGMRHDACSGAARRCWGEGPGRRSLPAAGGLQQQVPSCCVPAGDPMLAALASPS